MFVLIFNFGARACYSTTWYSWRHRFHFCPDPTVHTSTKDIRIRFYPLSRAFPNFYGFGGSDPRVSVDGRPKRIKNYTDSNESAFVWTGPKLLSICPFWPAKRIGSGRFKWKLQCARVHFPATTLQIPALWPTENSCVPFKNDWSDRPERTNGK